MGQSSGRAAPTDIDHEVEGLPAELERYQRLAGLLEQAPVLIVIQRGPEHAFELFSGKAREADGGRELLEKSFREALQDPTVLRPVLDRVYHQGGSVERREVPLIPQREGASEVRFVNSLHQPIRDEQGRIEGVMSIAFDVTEQVLARRAGEAMAEALRMSEERFRSIIQASAQAVWTTDAQGAVVEDSPSWRAFTGQTFEEARGLGWLEVVHPEERERIARVWAGAVAGREPVGFDHRIRTADGTYATTLVRAVPLLNADGSVREWVGVNVDITEQRRVQGERLRLLQELEAKEARTAHLLAVTSALSGAVTPEDVARVVLTGALEGMGAGAGLVYALHEDGGLHLLHAAGYEPEATRSYRALSSDARTPCSDAVRARAPIWLESMDELRTGYPNLEDIQRSTSHRSWAALPMLVHDGVVGAMVLSFKQPRSLPGKDRALLMALAQQGGQALERARLYADRRRAGEEATFLAQVGKTLMTSLDLKATLQRLVELAIPQLGDWCAVDLLGEDGRFQRLAIHHRDPAKIAFGFEIFRRYPPRREETVGLSRVVRTMKPELVAEISDAQLAVRAHDAEHLRILRAVGLSSYIVVPLVAQGRALGAMTFCYAESERRYGPGDLRLAEEFALRATLALENARLFELAQAERRRAEEASRLKDEFLATVSHELRTPLTAILGWLQILRGGTLSAEKRERALQTIDHSARAQKQLIEDLLDVSRIVTGQLRLELVPVELSDVVNAALEAVRPSAQARELQLQPELAPGIGPFQGDAQRLQQVVWNLLSNAVKFTPPGGRVHVLLRRVDGSAELAVRDSGQGIPREFLPHVFERFRQAESGPTRRFGGLGLGLAIVRHLVELHGGTVEAQSDGPGLGATFIVRLPIAARRTEAASRRREEDASGARQAWSPGLEGLRVLVVDDEPDARELLGVVLEQHKARVTAVGSVAEALAAIDRERPDVIVSDIGMPGEDGYGFIRRLRQRRPEEGGRIPAIALTAYARLEDRTRALLAGFQMHLPKPLDPDELLITIASVAGVLGRGAGGTEATGRP